MQFNFSLIPFEIEQYGIASAESLAGLAFHPCRLHIADCQMVLLPWKNFKDEYATNRKCPSCGNTSVLWSTFLFMAIVDKKPTDYLLWLLNPTPEQIFTWISKRKTL